MHVNVDEHLLQDSMDLGGTACKIHIGVRKWYLYLQYNALTRHHVRGIGILFDGLFHGAHHEFDESQES
jgi:hypothetical protein